MTLERRNNCNGWLSASAGELIALDGSLHPTDVAGECPNPCSKSSLATKSVFSVL